MALSLHESFERCCRLCAEEQEVSVMIFSAEAEAMLLQNKLNKYLLIEVDEEDKLPKNICIRCCSKLQTVCDFIDTARKAQEDLLNQSIILDQLNPQNCVVPKTEITSEDSDDENHITEMEISVDPMMVLQNSDSMQSPNLEDCNNEQEEDITHLHSVDGENVTIKLIKRGGAAAPTNDDEKKKKLKPFPCLTCKRSFYTELALKNHSWIHFSEDRVNKKFKCGTCRESFDYKCDLIVHLKNHRRNGMCKLCGRCFRTDTTLASHMAMHLSSSSKAYTCKVCGRSYNTQSNLKTHSVTHSNDRPYNCHLCNKSFKRNQDLKFHINQHTGAKPYKCPFCEKCFASSGNCYSHRSRMHPGRRVENKMRRRMTLSKEAVLQSRPVAPKILEAPNTNVKGIAKYQCSVCSHSFMKRDNYTYHMYQHTGEKPFQCTLCKEQFVTRRGLLLHHGKHHPEVDRPLHLMSKNVLLK